MNASPQNLSARLESLLGTARVSCDAEICADYAIDSVSPATIASPENAEQAAELVRYAASENLALVPCGNRTKLSIGMPPTRYDIALDTTSLNQIAHYDPADLTLSVGAGASFNDFAVPLYQQKQFLPLPTPFYFESTIGGIIASGLDSALRHSYGTVRDFLLGAEFIDGKGALCKSGGRVVKNVSGYDLHKLLIGSLGSLAVITQVNLRTFPLPPESRGLVASFESAAQALDLARLIAGSTLAPSSIELLGPQLLQLFLDHTHETDPSEPASAPLTGLFPENSWHLCISVEGNAEVCARYVRDLKQLASKAAAINIHVIDFTDSTGPDLWHHIGQAIPTILEASPSAAIFKIVELPSKLSPMVTQLAAVADQASLPQALMARASGILYFALLPTSNDEATRSQLESACASIFDLCARESASTALLFCPTQLKRTLNVWGAHRKDLGLMRALKSAFDPHDILAPGRFLDA
jgi:glycolate oxidase FAD binding subunit